MISITSFRQRFATTLDEPRSGGRLQPRAQALGKGKVWKQALKGRKKRGADLGNVVVHLIFSTKLRKPLIGPDIRPKLFAYLGGIVRELQGTALIVNGTNDHIHMLIRIRPAHPIAEIARIVKTNSSGWIRKKGQKEFAWQSGYAVFSVSESNIPAIIKYIASQDEHRRKKSFQEEFVAFLKKNNVEYDERYVWN